MRSSSPRLRTGVALVSTLLALVFTLGAPAFAGERGGKPEDGSNGSGRPTDTNPDDHPSGRDRSEESGGSGTQGQSGSDPDGDSNGGADKPGGEGGFDADKDGNNGCGNDDDFEDDNRGNCGGPERDRERCVHASEQGREHGQGRGVDGEPCEEESTGGTSTPPTTVAGNTSNTSTGNTSTDNTSNGTTTNTGTNTTSNTATNTATETVSGNVTAGGAPAVEVLGSTIDRDVPGAVLAAHPPIETKVLGVSVDRPSGGEAAGTGAAVLGTSVTRGALARTGSALMLVALAGLVLVLMGYGLKRYGRRSTI